MNLKEVLEKIQAENQPTQVHTLTDRWDKNLAAYFDRQAQFCVDFGVNAHQGHLSGFLSQTYWKEREYLGDEASMRRDSARKDLAIIQKTASRRERQFLHGFEIVMSRCLDSQQDFPAASAKLYAGHEGVAVHFENLNPYLIKTFPKLKKDAVENGLNIERISPSSTVWYMMKE